MPKFTLANGAGRSWHLSHVMRPSSLVLERKPVSASTSRLDGERVETLGDAKCAGKVQQRGPHDDFLLAGMTNRLADVVK